ncbi:MAG: FAD:protein FMN transferase, partial [Acidobacteria bacterium]|nr:FAD:protein FMN transferase [Acidobacteriota bacterium]
TAVSVMGPDEALKLIESMRGAAALIVVQTDQGTRTWKSKRWQGKPSSRQPETTQRRSGQAQREPESGWIPAFSGGVTK